MKIPFELRYHEEPGAVAGYLLLSREVDDLLALCLRMGGSLPPVFPVAGGFLVRAGAESEPLAGSVGGGTIRLQKQAGDLFLPLHAELTPALLPDEAAALTRQRGLVFLPGGRVLEYDPQAPVMPELLLEGHRLAPREWQPLPEPARLANRLVRITLDLPPRPPDVLLAQGNEDVGSEAPRPPEVGPVEGSVARGKAGLGQALLWLGEKLGLRGLARTGARMIEAAVRQAPRLSERILGRQEAALRQLLDDFQQGRTEEALRRALPLGNDPGRGSVAAGDARLPAHSLRYSLGELLGGWGGRASLWLGGMDVQELLAREYRRAAEQAAARGDHRRAAYIYGKLLHDYRLAADALARGGLHHDAAILYLEKVKDALAAARSFEAAGESDRALELYRQRGEHLAAGDLLRRIGEEEAALEEYGWAAGLAVRRTGDYAAAGNLLADHAGRPDLAWPYYLQGWQSRPGGNAMACLRRMAGHLAHEQKADELLALAREARNHYLASGSDQDLASCLAELVRLAGTKVPAVHPAMRDLALGGVAQRLRGLTGTTHAPGTVVSTLLGRDEVWPAEVVSDAEVAFRAALKAPRPAPRLVRSHPTHQLGDGPVQAACWAEEAGILFAGFLGGEVVRFQTRGGGVTRLISTQQLTSAPQRILALAASPKGDFLATLTRTPEGGLSLSSYRGGSHGLFSALGVHQLEERDPCGLTSVVEYNGTLLVGLWAPDRVRLLVGETLHPLPALERHSRKGSPIRGAELCWVAAPDDRRGYHVVWLDHENLAGSLRIGDPGGPSWERDASWVSLIGWSASLLPDCLRPFQLVSWSEGAEACLQLLHVTAGGSLCHSRHPLGRVAADGKECLVDADEGYLAGAVMEPRRLVGVRRDGLAWLRVRPGRLERISTTPADLDGAVACYVSVLTQEVLVLCRDGRLVRIGWPR